MRSIIKELEDKGFKKISKHSCYPIEYAKADSNYTYRIILHAYEIKFLLESEVFENKVKLFYKLSLDYKGNTRLFPYTLEYVSESFFKKLSNIFLNNK